VKGRIQFTKEPNNLTAQNTYKFSGLANRRAVGIVNTGAGAVLTLKGEGLSKKHNKSFLNVQLGANSRKHKKKRVTAKGLHQAAPRVVTAQVNQLRPDLIRFATKRLHHIALLNKKKAATRDRKNRGVAKPAP